MSSNVSLQFTNMEKWYSFPAELTTIPSVNLDDSVPSFYGQYLEIESVKVCTMVRL